MGIRQDAGGRVFAMELACRHQGGDLSIGQRAGAIVTCPRHAWRYDLETGACLTEPDLPLRALATKTEGDRLYVDPAPPPDE